MTEPVESRADTSGVDAEVFRQIMGSVAAPVTVVTGATRELVHGTTVSAFCSVSLRPPLVAVMLDNGSDLLRIIRRTRRFGINLLADDQRDLAMKFATKGAGKFESVAWVSDHGLPRLVGSTGWLVCRTARISRGGDHVIVLGHVTRAESDDRAPLIYHQRRFGTHTGWPGDMS
jgi:flavin reductase (DIM6/NTAB) family NADH-FMN oxidoreductase RutF